MPPSIFTYYEVLLAFRLKVAKTIPRRFFRAEAFLIFLRGG